jgi:hypothetical protein
MYKILQLAKNVKELAVLEICKRTERGSREPKHSVQNTATSSNLKGRPMTKANRVGLVHTDASCVCPMGCLAIFFCVLSSVLLASFQVLPLRRTQVGRKSWVLRPTCVLRFLRMNRTRYFSRPFFGAIRASTNLEEHWSADHERDCKPCYEGGDVRDGGGGGVRRGEIGRGGGGRAAAASWWLAAAASRRRAAVAGGGGDAAVAS